MSVQLETFEVSPRRERGGSLLAKWLLLAGRGSGFVALVATVMAALVLIVVPLATGSQTYTVLTSSMAPKYAPGTFLVVKPEPFDQLRVGDIITYQIESGKSDVITHRIVSVTATQQGERTFITKGDNNDLEDENPVREIQVRGQLFYAVPYVGFLANTMGQTDRGGMVKLAGAAIIGYGAISIIRGIAAKKRSAADRDR